MEDQKPQYYYENGLRKVQPYFFTYRAHAKERWIGKELLYILAKEFYQITDKYYKNAVDCGNITINGKKAQCDYIIRREDVMEHVTHRHEPPVIGDPPNVVFESESIIVVHKPASLPVHPTGRYTYNTLIGILRHEMGYKNLFPAHRLDRLTSGLCILALNKKNARLLSEKIKSGLFTKWYLAKVHGEFPEREIVCDKSILVASPKLGICLVSSERGKPCKTYFKRLSYDGKYSIVECRPVTGRTHQIRVHLKYIRFPIVNDPVYSSNLWPEIPDTTEYSDFQISQIVNAFHENGLKTPISLPFQGLLDDNQHSVRSLNNISNEKKSNYVNLCIDCLITRPDPSKENMYMCLHSWKYFTDDMSFEVPTPAWVHI